MAPALEFYGLIVLLDYVLILVQLLDQVVGQGVESHLDVGQLGEGETFQPAGDGLDLGDGFSRFYLREEIPGGAEGSVLVPVLAVLRLFDVASDKLEHLREQHVIVLQQFHTLLRIFEVLLLMFRSM